MLISHIKFGKHKVQHFKHKVCFKKKEIVHEGTLPHLADFLFLEAHILHRSLRSTSPHGNVQHNPKKIDCIKKKLLRLSYST